MRWVDYERGEAELRPWDPASFDIFDFVAASIAEVLPAAAVEHIGSTAVPGLPGKGYIDLMVLSASDAETERSADKLLTLGLTPARGSTSMRPFLLGAVDTGDRHTNVHVYVIRDDSDEAAAQRGLAEALRADPELRADYARLKTGLVSDGITPVEYSMRKIRWVLTTLDKLGLPALPDPGAPPPPRQI